MSFVLEHKEVFMLLGIGWVLYVIKRYLRLFLIKRKDAHQTSLFDDLAGIVCVILTIFSLPVSMVGFSIDSAYESRISQKLERHMRLAEMKYKGKCTHCYSHAVSSRRPFHYNFETFSWNDNSFSDIYIPPRGCWPDSGSTEHLQKDIYTALKAQRPFCNDHIGQTDPFSKCIIENEEDYDYFLFCLSCRYADSYNDPFG